MSQQITPPQPQPKSKQSDSAASHFDLSIAYRLLIRAYVRSIDKAQGSDDGEAIKRIKQTKHS